MKTFHILYFINIDDIYSKGVNIKANTPEEAITIFRNEYNKEPSVIYDIEMISKMKIFKNYEK